MTVTGERPPRGPYAKSRVRRSEIVDAAIRVFASRGYHGGSMREISREIGMSLTAVTHHFPAKSDLLEAVLDRTEQEGREFDKSEGVVAYTLALAEHNLARPELLRVLAIVSAEASAPDHPAHPWFVARYQRLRERNEGYVRRDQELGRLDAALDAAFLADALIAVWDGLQLQWLIDPDIDMVGRFRAALTALFRPPA